MAVSETSGVIMIKNIPYGFFEEQMKDYFTQFGTVERVKIARSRKSGGSRGFGFVLFEEASVAKIAAKAMDNYLMFDEVLKCHYIPHEKVREGLFKEADTDKTTRQLHMDLYNNRHDKTGKRCTRNIAKKNKKTPPGAIKKRKAKPWKDQKKDNKILAKPENDNLKIEEEDSVPLKRRKTPKKGRS